MSDDAQLLFPVWQIDPQEYRAICAHLSITPRIPLYDRLSSYLASAPFRFARPTGFSLSLARLRLTRFRIARLDVATKLFFSQHPVRHVLNGVIALHECDGEGYREMSAAPTGRAALLDMAGWALGYAWRLGVTIPWLGWQLLGYTAAMPFRREPGLAGRRILITGVNRGLGKDLMLHCVESGAEVVGTVRNAQAEEMVKAWLPAEAPVTLLIADLSKPEALAAALGNARIVPESLDAAILNAGVKHDGESVLSLSGFRDTFQVNLFSAAEFAKWLCSPAADQTQVEADRAARARAAPAPKGAAINGPHGNHPGARTALVLVSSMGRWHGMHSVCGYNASKAALSIWGECLEMELRQSGDRRFTVTIVEPGIFESGMSRQTPLTRFLFVSRREVARRIVAGALAGKRSMRPPGWFAVLTWAVCIAGRDFRYRLFSRAKTTGDRR